MDKKLTLSLNQGIIERAKNYAKSNNTSLSKLIEAYFDSLTNTIIVKTETMADVEITPFVESLCGMIELPSDFDYKKAKSRYLIKKYG